MAWWVSMSFQGFIIGAATAGVDPSPWMILPFVIMLLSIAVMPFINKHFWEHYYPQIAVALGSITLGYYLFGLGEFTRPLHTAHEYITFMALLGSLFVVTGGIHITVKTGAKPWFNVLFLATGAVLANFIGTTGASMLLIRPWIRMNKYRVTKFHIVFFIFIVSNCGGCLTPIGDPPLFLGYLKGIPFFWTLEHLWVEWLFVCTVLLGIFWILDQRNYSRAPKEAPASTTEEERWQVQGLGNVFFIGLILTGVFLPSPWRESLMIGAALGSYFYTPKVIHQRNEFNFLPIKEVAWLFVGIFATMMPALDYLQLHSRALGLETARQYYFITGLMSALLDNAPTYLTFLTVALASQGLSLDMREDVLLELARFPDFVVGISLGAVFFGAMTYIGNGPNFMVKAIADQSKVETPSFFGYIFRYSIPFLLPVLILIGFWRLS
jgi:Na+/H+ antiporter NhaD/arsenite permease-like protein